MTVATFLAALLAVLVLIVPLLLLLSALALLLLLLLATDVFPGARRVCAALLRGGDFVAPEAEIVIDALVTAIITVAVVIIETRATFAVGAARIVVVAAKYAATTQATCAVIVVTAR